MNREKIIELRNFILTLPKEKFNMAEYGLDHCGSPACIGGWGLRLFKLDCNYPAFLHAQVGEVLGLSSEDAEELFMAGTPAYTIWRYGVTATDAVKVLDHLLATGEVDWSVVIPNYVKFDA